MLRRQARLRREYLFEKAKETRRHKSEEKKQKLINSLTNNKTIHPSLQREAIGIQEKLKYSLGKELYMEFMFS